MCVCVLMRPCVYSSTVDFPFPVLSRINGMRNILAQVVFMEANHSVWALMVNLRATHRAQKRKQKLLCEPQIRSQHYGGGDSGSNTFRAAARPHHLHNAGNLIWSAWPPSATTVDVCPPPTPPHNWAWLPLSRGLHLIPWSLAVVGMVTR